MEEPDNRIAPTRHGDPMADPAELYRQRGFGGQQRAGRRPALIVVDMILGFTDSASPLHCDTDEAVAAIDELLGAARRANRLVAFTTVVYDESTARVAAAFIEKVPSLLTLQKGSRWVEIDPRIAPAQGEPVLTKLFASAFFGTPLAPMLAAHGCDTVIVTGASTSGCVRATAVDALQHGYRVAVPRAAVADRAEGPHQASLFDIGQKYGSLLDLQEAITLLLGSEG
jgi:nicotinamidase-related amidase